MRKHSLALLATVVALLAAPALATAPAADEDLLLCSATAAAEAPVPEAAPAEEIALEIEEAANPKPVPAWCPQNERCTFFCLDYPDCPVPQCIQGVCVYSW